MPIKNKDSLGIVSTVKKVMPAVVSIMVTKKLQRLEKEMRDECPPAFQDLPARVSRDRVDARGMVQVGGGSGFIVDGKGTILTNKHVISEPFAEYTAVLNNGERYPAEILARDPLDDIAILRIAAPKGGGPAVAELGDSRRLELGEMVLAFGNALGTFKNTVSLGIISGLSRAIEAKTEASAQSVEMRGLIQTDAAINPGNSGGPLTDALGKVIGINTAVISGAQNIGFAIPIHAAYRDLLDLKKFGKIKRPLLGIRYLTINPDIKEKLKLPVDYGALVIKEHPLDVAIAPGGPADKAGIRERDIILDWNGKKITEEMTIQDFLEEASVGDKAVFSVGRGGRVLKKKVALTERK